MSDGSIIIDTRLDTSGAENGVSGLSGKLNKLAKGSLKATSAGIAMATSALGGMATYALKVGGDFEEGMSKVKAISGATAEDMTKLTEKAKEMGAKTKFSATESAEALQYMAMAGWKTNDMLNGLEGIMNLAAASGEDLALTSDIVTDALTAFGLKASDSAHFADILASASSNSNTNVSMLGESFKYVAPLCGSLKFSAEDTAIALGLMANAGIKGSQGGTALRASLSRLVKPTGDVAAAMDQYGITLTNSDGSMKTLGEVMDLLRDKMGGLDESTKAQVATTLFGQEAMSGMLAIINASPEDYEKLTNAIKNCDGAAENMADTMNDNLKGQVTLLKSALEGLGIAVYEKFQEPLKNVVKGINEMVGQLQTAFNERGFEGLAEALGTVLSEGIKNITSQLPGFVSLGIKVIKSLINGIQQNAVDITSALVDVCSTIVDGLFNILPAVLELGIKVISYFLQGIANQLPYLIQGAIECITELINTILEDLPLVVEVGMEILEGLVKGLIEAIPVLLEALPEILDNLIQSISEALPTILEKGKDILLALVDGLVQAIPKVIEELPKIINAIIKGITDNLPIIIDAGIQVMLALIDGLIEALPQLIDYIPQIIESFLRAIIENLPQMVDCGYKLWFGVVKGVLKASVKLIEAIPRLIKSIKNLITGVDWISLGKDAIKGMIKGLAMQGVKILDKIKELFQPVTDFFEQLGQDISDKFTEGFDALVSFFTEDIPKAFDDFCESAKEFVDKVKQSIVTFFTEDVPQAIDDMIQWFEELPYEIGYKLGEMAAKVVEWKNNVVAYFKELPGKIAEAFTEAYNNTKQWLSDTYNSCKESIGNTIESITTWFSELPDRIGTWFSETYNRVAQWLTDTYNTAKQKASEIVDGIVNYFKELPGRIWSWLSSVIDSVRNWGRDMKASASEAAKETADSIISWFKDLPSRMFNIGANIVTGIWNGIKSAGDWLKSKINEFCSGIKDGFLDFFDIHSPSRLMRDLVGKNIVRGIGVGIDVEGPQLNDIAIDNMQDLYRQLRSTVDIETAKTTANVVAKNNITLNEKGVIDNTAKSRNSGVCYAEFNLEGRHVASATAPYMDQELAKIQGYKERGRG